PKDIEFEQFCQLVLRNLLAFDASPEIPKTRDEIDTLREDYKSGAPSGIRRNYDDEFKERLGYILINLFGEQGFLILVAKPN
ncbi:MAG: hypothetical protein ACRD8U_11810, partial [Pyrinomonadaceae bacterium]